MKMLGLGSLLQPCNSSSAFTPFSQYLINTLSIPYRTNSFFSSPYSNSCSNVLFLQGRNGFSVFAVKKQKKSSKSPLELEGFDEIDDDEEEEEEEDGVIIPLSGMKEWFEKKPSGFGEGKEYDTSLEDKLLEELEQSRKAQLANINNLKNNPLKSSSKEEQTRKVPEGVPSGVRVRVGNLPKKKNIQRDLQLVFKGFPAIVNISPAVSGNKKTRDPICKGFAFVDLGSEEAAKRFVQTYSRKSITFGKVQKQITCEITKPQNSTDPASEHSAKVTYMSTPQPRLPAIETGSDADSSVDDFSVESWEVNSPDETDGQADQLILATSEAIEESIEHINLSVPNDNENTRPRTVDKTDSSLKQQKKKQTIKKKPTVKGKSAKVPNLNVPGSTKRLKVKEKAVLAGVFSKYGAKPSLALTKER